MTCRPDEVLWREVGSLRRYRFLLVASYDHRVLCPGRGWRRGSLLAVESNLRSTMLKSDARSLDSTILWQAVFQHILHRR